MSLKQDNFELVLHQPVLDRLLEQERPKQAVPRFLLVEQGALLLVDKADVQKQVGGRVEVEGLHADELAESIGRAARYAESVVFAKRLVVGELFGCLQLHHLLRER